LLSFAVAVSRIVLTQFCSYLSLALVVEAYDILTPLMMIAISSVTCSDPFSCLLTSYEHAAFAKRRSNDLLESDDVANEDDDEKEIPLF